MVFDEDFDFSEGGEFDEGAKDSRLLLRDPFSQGATDEQRARGRAILMAKVSAFKAAKAAGQDDRSAMLASLSAGESAGVAFKPEPTSTGTELTDFGAKVKPGTGSEATREAEQAQIRKEFIGDLVSRAFTTAGIEIKMEVSGLKSIVDSFHEFLNASQLRKHYAGFARDYIGKTAVVAMGVVEGQSPDASALFRAGGNVFDRSIINSWIPPNKGKYLRLKRQGKLDYRGRMIPAIEGGLGRQTGVLLGGIKETARPFIEASQQMDSLEVSLVFNKPEYLADVHDGKVVDYSRKEDPWQDRTTGESKEDIRVAYEGAEFDLQEEALSLADKKLLQQLRSPTEQSELEEIIRSRGGAQVADIDEGFLSPEQAIREGTEESRESTQFSRTTPRPFFTVATQLMQNHVLTALTSEWEYRIAYIVALADFESGKRKGQGLSRKLPLQTLSAEVRARAATILQFMTPLSRENLRAYVRGTEKYSAFYPRELQEMSRRTITEDVALPVLIQPATGQSRPQRPSTRQQFLDRGGQSSRPRRSSRGPENRVSTGEQRRLLKRRP